MKRILSVLLVLSMILTSLFALSACTQPEEDNKGVTAEEFKNNAQAALIKVSQNTMDAFFTDDAGIDSIVEEALKAGSAKLEFEAREELIGADLKIGETIYFDAANKKYVSDTEVTFDGETLAGRVFVDKNGVAINGSDILGSDRTIAINPATLVSGFLDSALAKLLVAGGDSAEIDDETKEIIETSFSEFKKQYDKLFSDETNAEFNKYANELYTAMGLAVTEEKVDGADVIVLTLTINNDNLETVFDKVFSIAKAQMPGTESLPEEAVVDFEQAMEEAEAAIDEALAMIDENAELSVSSKLYVLKKEGKMLKGSLNGELKFIGEIAAQMPTDTMTVSAEMTYSDTENKVVLNADMGEQKFDATVTLKKTGTEYKLSVNVGDGKGADINALNITYKYNENGSFTLAVDVYGDPDRTVLTVSGTVTKTDKTAKIEITSVAINAPEFEEEISFKLALTFDKSAKAPALPSDAKDIVELTEEDWAAIMEEIQGSKLFEYMGSFSGSADTAPIE